MRVSKCRICIYRSEYRNINKCDYITITGHMRGCPPGEECTKFAAGDRLPTPEKWRIHIESATPEEREIGGYLAQVLKKTTTGIRKDVRRYD